MIRRSRLILGAALVIAAGCASDAPTAPAPNTLSPETGALTNTSADTSCRSGWSVPNGKSC